MQRRTLLKAGLAAASALSLPLGIRQAFAAEPFTFYGLKSMSGAFASYGKFADMGSRLAVEQYPQLLGRPLARTAHAFSRAAPCHRPPWQWPRK